ncbi:GvpL/GvpF family gas vesicle protein [Prolixibacteraceae bacterium JC049]|nr:GvpL/GvpF family gas vesicle protein [Prolixibacteraceae bacterium JC049]
MQKDGKYVYCVIESSYDSYFGDLGIGDESMPVTTIGYEDICMVVSDHPINNLEVNSENILSHQHVIEKVMQEYDSVLPIRFGTIATNADEIRNLLQRRYRELKDLLYNYRHMFEINIKCCWRNIETIFQEINNEYPNIFTKCKQIEQNTLVDKSSLEDKMAHTGELVTKALKEKKRQEQKTILNAFKAISFNYKHNIIVEDNMIMNTAFLINSGREREIDHILCDLDFQFHDRMDIFLTSPLPIFNFIDLKILPEQWEL